MELNVRRYQPSMAPQWAEVVRESRNGLFLFERPYMEYHGARFADLSSIAFLDDKPVAVFPVARDPITDQVTSHPGLTFGGVALKRELRSGAAMDVINGLLDALKTDDVSQLTVKLLPEVFASYPSAELHYALWRRGFTLSRRDLSSVLPLNKGLSFNTSKRQAVARAKKAGVLIAPASPLEFHQLLSQVLKEQHGATPVHSAAELALLVSLFPTRISIEGAWIDNVLLAGSVVFRYGHVWHTQYLACSSDGRDRGALDLVISEIKMDATASGVEYISFGASTENMGTEINEGLLWQKESFGARSITHDFMTGKL